MTTIHNSVASSWRHAALVAMILGAISTFTTAAHAGDCPAPSKVADGQGQKPGPNAPVGLSVMATIDGTNNFRDSYSPALGAILTREFGEHGAIHVEPIWVNNTNDKPSEVVDHNDTFLLGIGGRIRVRPTVYVVAEIAPRLAGFDPKKTSTSFALEKRAGVSTGTRHGEEVYQHRRAEDREAQPPPRIGEDFGPEEPGDHPLGRGG